jgi:hypothetical protein
MPVLLAKQASLHACTSRHSRRREYLYVCFVRMLQSASCLQISHANFMSVNLKSVDAVIPRCACFQLRLPPASFQTALSPWRNPFRLTAEAYPSKQQTITWSAITPSSINSSRLQPSLLCLSNVFLCCKLIISMARDGNYDDGVAYMQHSVNVR